MGKLHTANFSFHFSVRDSNPLLCVYSNMTEVCEFIGADGKARKQLSYAIKQIIAKEVEVEKMRRTERLMTGKAQKSEAVRD